MEFKWKKQEMRVQIVASHSTFFYSSRAHRRQEVSLSVAQISCLERTVTEIIVNPVQKPLYELSFSEGAEFQLSSMLHLKDSPVILAYKPEFILGWWSLPQACKIATPPLSKAIRT